MRAGDYDTTSQVALYRISPASNVTLQPAPDATAKLGWLNLGDDVHNVTFRGLNLSGGVSGLGSQSNLVFDHNTISGADSGFFFYGNGGTVSNIQIVYNQLDHLDTPDLASNSAGQCLTVLGGAGQMHNFTFSHNVCGPGIGDHYTQIGGIDSLTMNNNAFVGPPSHAHDNWPDPPHNNILQVFGDSNNVDFSHNTIRDAGARGQDLLFQHGSFTHVRLNNNLFVNEVLSFAIGLCPVNDLTVTNNTIVNSKWGTNIGNPNPGGCGLSSVSSNNISHNIIVATQSNTGLNIGPSCTSGCVVDYNVTDDGSANQSGSTHPVANWTPRWTDTISYQPTGLPFAAGFRP
jgi:hypothetical protein